MYKLLPQINYFPDFQITPLPSSQQIIPPQFKKTAIFAGGNFSLLYWKLNFFKISLKKYFYDFSEANFVIFLKIDFFGSTENYSIMTF